MPAVLIPAAIRRHMTSPQSQCTVEADTVRAALHALVARYPELRPALFEPDMRLRGVVRVFVGERAANLDTAVSASDEILLLPPIAGG